MSAIVAITGGIACGKSHCLKVMGKNSGAAKSAVFSCDKAVSNLLTDSEIIGRLKRLMGDVILEGDGTINRSILREKIFNNAEIRKKVEDVLHPPVLKMAEGFIENSRGSQLALLEIPLLYEVNFPIKRDFDLVIGCSKQTQISRLTGKRGISHEQAGKILSSQMSIQEKANLAHFVAWNDGCLQSFEDQLLIISKIILSNTKGT